MIHGTSVSPNKVEVKKDAWLCKGFAVLAKRNISKGRHTSSHGKFEKLLLVLCDLDPEELEAGNSCANKMLFQFCYMWCSCKLHHVLLVPRVHWSCGSVCMHMLFDRFSSTIKLARCQTILRTCMDVDAQANTKATPIDGEDDAGDEDVGESHGMMDGNSTAGYEGEHGPAYYMDHPDDVISLSDSEICKDEVEEPLADAGGSGGVAEVTDSICPAAPSAEAAEEAGDSQLPSFAALMDGDVEEDREAVDENSRSVMVDESPAPSSSKAKSKQHKFEEEQDASRVKTLTSNLEALKKKLQMKRTESFNKHVRL